MHKDLLLFLLHKRRHTVSHLPFFAVFVADKYRIVFHILSLSVIQLIIQTDSPFPESCKFDRFFFQIQDDMLLAFEIVPDEFLNDLISFHLLDIVAGVFMR